jgi:xanthine dehydrogenase small subunit
MRRVRGRRRDGRGERTQRVSGDQLLSRAAARGRGREVWTVEGVRRNGAVHPVQQAMVENGGSQCGYCTPGFVMSLFAYYYSEPRPQPMAALSGNLCRCTGYRPIRDAAAQLAAQRSPAMLFGERLQRAAPVPAVAAIPRG